MWWLALLVPPALALDGRDGVALPGASPLEAGRGHVGVIGGVLAIPGGSATAAGIELGVGLTDRLALFGLIGAGRVQGVFQDDDLLGGIVTLRGNVVESKHVRLGLLLTGSVGAATPIGASLGAGFALQAGGRRTWLDLSVPSAIAARATVVDGEYELQPMATPLGAEVGVSLPVGPHNRLRIGFPALVTWQIRRERYYIDLSATPTFLFNGVTAGGGARF